MGHRLQPNPVAGPALADTDPLPPITVEDLARPMPAKQTSADHGRDSTPPW